ncbi:hypothetical protein EDD18DRAFT_1358690 [Armillaria luteobubalina]|uniref:Ribonuclease H1 N-terminal domain-containing protein n=1 Tax=Armillaria luteobubalina TaxID=153913 RepID=A0AA39PVV1_9AGAR|nr:hypothetical protein EDD18DRAFT_1358690 [Armillaria luteobubalina]
MTPTPQSYLESLDSTQLAQLILALEQCGIISAAATLPTTPGATHSAAANHSAPGPTCLAVCNHFPLSVSAADMAMSVATVPGTSGEPLSLPSKPMVLRKARRGRSAGSQAQAPCPNVQSPWYTVTVGYQVRIFQGWNTVIPLVLNLDGAVYLAHPTYAAAYAHYANAMANDQVEIILSDDKEDI